MIKLNDNEQSKVSQINAMIAQTIEDLTNEREDYISEEAISQEIIHLKHAISIRLDTPENTEVNEDGTDWYDELFSDEWDSKTFPQFEELLYI